MMTAPPNPKTTLTLIWFMMMSMIGGYWFVRVMAKVSAQPNAGTALLAYLLLALAAVTYGVAWWWFRRLLADISRDTDPLRLQQMSPEHRAALTQRLRDGTIAGLGLVEIPTVYGLITVFIGSPLPGMFEGLALTTLAAFVMVRLKTYPIVFELLDRLALPTA